MLGEEELLSGSRARLLLVDIVAVIDAVLLRAGVCLSECGSWQEESIRRLLPSHILFHFVLFYNL